MHVIFALLLQMQMDHHQHAAAERLGTVSFKTSCAPSTQAGFTRGVALLHSFWYAESEKVFRRVAEADPQCGMAWWGVAMSNFHQVWPSPYNAAEKERGIAAVAKAKEVGAKTLREQAYIEAIQPMFRDPRAYEAAMQKIVADNPDDDEAQIFYSLILINHGMANPKDKTYAYQKQAAEILNRLLPTHQDHPGIAHYLIHSFDYPALAPLALNAANVYAKIAPSSPHALHMPSHIYVRLGMWPETIASNLASQRAAAAAHSTHDLLHADDYLAYAWLQRGEDAKVRELMKQVSAITIDVDNFAAYYAAASIPARYTIEGRRWKEAASLPVTKWDSYPYAESLTHFARAVGAARIGKLDDARNSVAELQRLRGKMSGYWSDVIDVQRREAEAWISRAEGKDDDALAMMRSAADLEDSMDKSPVTPGPPQPAREMLGDLLLELKQPAAAAEAYQLALKSSPNRRNALEGIRKTK